MDDNTTNDENMHRGRGHTNIDVNYKIRMLIWRNLWVTQEEITNDIWKYDFGTQ